MHGMCPAQLEKLQHDLTLINLLKAKNPVSPGNHADDYHAGFQWRGSHFNKRWVAVNDECTLQRSSWTKKHFLKSLWGRLFWQGKCCLCGFSWELSLSKCYSQLKKRHPLFIRHSTDNIESFRVGWALYLSILSPWIQQIALAFMNKQTNKKM